MSRTLLGALAFLFAISTAFAADSPEQVYKKLSDAWAKAKTLHLDGVKTTQEMPGTTLTLDSSAWVGENNCLRLEVNATVGGQTHKNQVISDGQNVVSLADGAERGRHAAGKQLGEQARGMLLAGGVMLAGAMLGGPAAPSVSAADFKPTSEAKVGDHDAIVLEYTLVVAGEPKDAHMVMKLYFDKTTFQVLKREGSNEKQGVKVTEEYPTIEVDKEAPKDSFKLPPAPKSGK